MADFISNFAILTAIQPQHCAYGRSLDRPKVRKMADFMAKSAMVVACRRGYSKRLFWQPNQMEMVPAQEPGQHQLFRETGAGILMAISKFLAQRTYQTGFFQRTIDASQRGEQNPIQSRRLE